MLHDLCEEIYTAASLIMVTGILINAFIFFMDSFGVKQTDVSYAHISETFAVIMQHCMKLLMRNVS